MAKVKTSVKTSVKTEGKTSMKTLFDEQQGLINYFFDQVDHSRIEFFAGLIEQCVGTVYLTGMGKSGIIAQNISQMLVSTGTKAMFLDPVNSLHGDVGVVNQDDLVVLFSKSGQTAELLQLMPAVRNKKARMIAAVSNVSGLIAQNADEVIHLPMQKELCPFDLAPTTSSAIQLIFGNTVVAYLMKKTGLTKEAYALNHPAGRIGKRLTIKVEDVMRPISDLALCGPEEELLSKIGQMSARKCGCLVVIDDSNEVGLKLLGIFTDGDLRRAIETHGTGALSMTLGKLMSKQVAVTRQGVKAFEAMMEMERDDEESKKRVKELPVVDQSGYLEGLLLLHDLVQYGL